MCNLYCGLLSQQKPCIEDFYVLGHEIAVPLRVDKGQRYVQWFRNNVERIIGSIDIEI